MDQLRECRDGLLLEEIGDVVLLIWRDAATVERARRMVPFVRDSLKRHPEGVLMLILILPTSDPPNAESRALSQAFIREINDRLRFTSTVALGDSFRMAVVRSIMRGITLLGGQKKKNAINSTIAEGVAQLAPYKSASTPTYSELVAACTQALVLLGVEPPRAAPVG